MKTLYDIDIELQLCMTEAESEAELNDGEISEILFNKIDIIEQEKNVKVGNICRYYKSLIAESNMVNEESKKLSQRAKTANNKAVYLKEYLSSYVKEGEKFADENSKISWRKCPQVLIPDSIKYEDVPEEWVKTEKAWKKAIIKDAIKNNENIPEGIKIITPKHIQIK